MNKWEDNIRKVVPYVAGEQPIGTDIIKLNTNENPYPPAPGVEKLSREIDSSRFSLYPDADAVALVDALTAYHGLQPGQLFVGVGSDDVLALAFLTFFNSKKPILFPDITYSFYPVWSDVYQIPYETIPVDADFKVNPADYARENGGVVIANPNAPTSIAMGLDQVETIIQENPDVIVIIDEAYVDFGGETALPLLDKYENLLVVRTYSKSRSMAGMRIGYAMANTRLIQAMKDVKESINSYTMNMASIILGAESVKDDGYFKNRIAQVVATRERVKEALTQMDFDVKDSATNFLFAGHSNIPAKYIFEQLRQKKIFVRYFDKPRINNYLRITIGTDKQMDTVLKAIDECIKNYEN